MIAKLAVMISLATACIALAAWPARAQYHYYNHHLALDGVGDYCEVSSISAPPLAYGLTVEAWIKTNVSTGDQAIVARYNNSIGTPINNSDDAYQLSVHGGKARFQISAGNNFFIVDGTRTVADGNWHHVAGVYDGAWIHLLVDSFVDGGRTAYGQLNNPPSTKLRIGAAYVNSSPGFFFSGLVDEVRIYYQTMPDSYIFANRVLPLRATSGSYPITAAWRFNLPNDRPWFGTYVGDAHEVPDDALLTSPTGVNLVNDACLDLHGTEYLSVFSFGSLPVSTAITVEAKVASTNTSGTLQVIVARYRANSASNADDCYALAIEPSGVARFQISNGSTFQTVNGMTNLLDGRLHHVAGTYDGHQLRVFVDGGLEGTAPLTGNIPNPPTNLLIGAQFENLSPGDFFVGSIDDLRIWNVARTEQEIHDNRKSCWYDFPQSLVARWLFEGDFLDLVSLHRGDPNPVTGNPNLPSSERILFGPANNSTCNNMR